MADIVNVQVNKFELKRPDVADPVAQKVSWEPARFSGSNVGTHVLRATATTVTVVRTRVLVLFATLFMVAGAALAGMGLLEGMNGDWSATLIMGGVGAAFFGAGFSLVRGNDLLTFDKARGVYFRGRAYQPTSRPDRLRQGPLSGIHAIQLLSEVVVSPKSAPYTSYELNLVFGDGERLTVMDHGDGAEVTKSGRLLGAFLGVAVWQAVY